MENNKYKNILRKTGYITELEKHEVLFYIDDLEKENEVLKDRLENLTSYLEIVKSMNEEFKCDWWYNTLIPEILEVINGEGKNWKSQNQ